MPPGVSVTPVIQAVSLFLAHVPGLVRHGSKPVREIEADPGLLERMRAHLRSFERAAAYPPNHAFLGGVDPDQLATLARPWFDAPMASRRWHPHGEIMPEEEFLGVLKWCDTFDLLRLEESFVTTSKRDLNEHPHLDARALEQIGSGHPPAAIEEELGKEEGALPIDLRSGQRVGSIRRAHAQDESLTAQVMLENLACKATAAMAMQNVLQRGSFDPRGIEYVVNCGEEAIGDRYQRGGGNLAKAVAELTGCTEATGSDVKAFCCGPLHALLIAGSLVQAGVFRQVAVVAGGSLAKLGMKFEGHLHNDQPILEDVLGGLAVIVGRDDGRSPILRLDAVGRHPVRAGSSQHEIYSAVVAQPLETLGLRFADVDKYAPELHNPEVTEPSGSGNVPALNYRYIAALAVRKGELTREEMEPFIARHGMPGFSPTQGHIASAVAYLGHAVTRLQTGTARRIMLVGKGSLFLGRMTQMSDGVSILMERNGT
jgi:glycine/sarcosine/betaine reductase complex component C subunit beta